MRFDISGLLAQAKKEAPVRYGPQPGLVITDPELRKFAELVALECAKVCSEQRDPSNLNYKPSERMAEAIKRHFGL